MFEDDVNDFREDIMDVLGFTYHDLIDYDEEDKKDGCDCGGSNCMDCLGLSYRNF